MPPPEGVSISGERVEFAQLIQRNGEALGTLYLRARYDVVSRVETYFSIFVLVTLLCLTVAFLLSRRLQRGITEPLDAMVAVARDVVTRRDYSLRVQKISDDEIGVVVDAFNNMLEEVDARSQALTLATARLESTMAAAEIGSWVWDIRKNEFKADRNLAALYGLGEYELNGPPELHYSHIHPEDLDAVRKAEQIALSGGAFASTEFRVQLKDGSEKWMARRGKVQLDEDGKVVFISGLLIDITAQKQAEKALRSSERLYRAIGESIDYGVWVCDRDGRNLYVSESFLRLLGFTQEQYSNFGWAHVLHPDDARETLESWAECVKTGGVWYRENRFRGADAAYHSILSQGVPIRGETEISGWAGINLDISRLKLTEDALRVADRRKDEFLATLAHELRNPLAPVRLAVKVLESRSLKEGQDQWARDVISRQVRRMALLLDDLLDVSRITQGRLDLKLETVSLDSLIEAAVETARPLIESKRHRLSIDMPSEPVMLTVDPLRLSQSLSNLLTNSAKYTDEGGHIDLRVTLSPDEITLAVKDTGIGLDAESLAGLFEMFSQVNSAIARSEGGLGIGLALVKGLITLHNGTIDARSPGPGMGSEFTIHLPRAAVTSGASAETPQHSAFSRRQESKHRIVVADDNRDAADSLAMLLETDGYSVSVGYCGKEALLLAQGAAPDAMILDIGMPDLTGYEVARRVRAERWGAGIYLIAATGWGQKEDKAQAFAAGFDHHLTKPVDPDEVEQVLQAFFDRRRGLDKASL